MGRLSFGSQVRLMENLGVLPGAVSPFAMINGVKNNVTIFLETKLKFYKKVQIIGIVLVAIMLLLL